MIMYIVIKLQDFPSLIALSRIVTIRTFDQLVIESFRTNIRKLCDGPSISGIYRYLE